jgi:hypothetical protein
MRNGKWEMGNGKWEMGTGKWRMENGGENHLTTMDNGQREKEKRKENPQADRGASYIYRKREKTPPRERGS